MLRFGALGRRPRFGLLASFFMFAALAFGSGCEPKNATEAEGKKDIGWLVAHPSGESVAALGRLADSDPRALAALEARAPSDVNTYIAAWTAVSRGASWGKPMLDKGLADPTTADMAASALPRGDARVAVLLPQLEDTLLRLAAGQRSATIAGIIASMGPTARPAVERRLIDDRTRHAMCDGLSLPEATASARAALLAVPPEARDHPACVTTVIGLAEKDPAVIDWLATSAEPGLLGAASKGSLDCARLASLWSKALSSRPSADQASLTVPLARSISRCVTALDPVLADLLARAPRARATIVQAIEPYSSEPANLTATCGALRKGYARGETDRVRQRANDAVHRGCAFTR